MMQHTRTCSCFIGPPQFHNLGALPLFCMPSFLIVSKSRTFIFLNLTSLKVAVLHLVHSSQFLNGYYRVSKLKSKS